MNRIFFIVFIFALFVLVGCASSRPGPLVYVANEGDGTISVVDSTALKVVDTIQLAGMPHNVNVDPLGRYVYATNHEGEEETENHDAHAGHQPYLRIIDATTHTLLRSVPMKAMAAHVVPRRDGTTVYVSLEGSKDIVEVDVDKGIIVNEWEVGNKPHGIVLSNDGTMLYTPNMGDHTVSALDLSTNTAESIELSFDGKRCDTPVAMGISSDDAFAYVTCGKSFDVYKIDTQTQRVIGRVALEPGNFPGPIQIPVHPVSGDLYVPDMYHGVVHVIDGGSFTPTKDIPTGMGSHGIAFSADGKRAYVTNTWEDTLAVLDLERETVIAKIAVGVKPNGVAVIGGKNQGW